MAVSLEPVQKASDKLKGLLNDAIAREIQVSVQYMWQHVQAMGVKAVAVQDKFKNTAIVGDETRREDCRETVVSRGNPDNQTCAHRGRERA